MIKKLLFKLNDRLTRKKFTHINSARDMCFTVAHPEDFYSNAAKNGYNIFKMQCVQSYIQLDNGKWQKGLAMPFEDAKAMRDAGIILIR